MPIRSAPALLYEAPDPQEISTSAAGNDFGFHGLPHDPETGFVYMRNRYYDPELGRFISADPMGYVDGPSLYVLAGSDPFNSRDPYGLLTIRAIDTGVDLGQGRFGYFLEFEGTGNLAADAVRRVLKRIRKLKKILTVEGLARKASELAKEKPAKTKPNHIEYLSNTLKIASFEGNLQDKFVDLGGRPIPGSGGQYLKSAFPILAEALETLLDELEESGEIDTQTRAAIEREYNIDALVAQAEANARRRSLERLADPSYGKDDDSN